LKLICLGSFLLLCVFSNFATAGAQTNPARVDFDANGVVGFGDFILFAGHFDGTHPTYDLNGDGLVQFGDFIEFTGHFEAIVTMIEDVEVLEGTISEDKVLTADRVYLLRGAVFVGAGAKLIVLPGVVIQGESASRGRLVVSQGAQLIADGLSTAPIVMTSESAEGNRSRGQWGGLVLNGRAPINTSETAMGSGDSGLYGGTDPDDSSGILRYLRVEFAGFEFAIDDVVHGISFQGVGSATVVDYVQVHFSQDDGVALFGGTVDLKHLLCTGVRDDSFDWTDGWVGRGQFWIVQQRGDDADNGIEADNDSNENDASPRSNPTIYNATLIGDPSGPEGDVGVLLRGGTAGTLKNFIVLGFGESGVDLDNAPTFILAENGDLSLTNSILANAAGNFSLDDDSFSEELWLAGQSDNAFSSDPLILDAFDQTSPDFSLSPISGALSGAALPPDDGFFEAVTFIGGMGADDDWTAGWTTTEQPADP
jgi:hypothetical protein